MRRFLLSLVILSLVRPAVTSADGAHSPGKIWGWFKVRSGAEYRVMEVIMSVLSGEHYFIRYLHLPGMDKPVTLLCLPVSAMQIVGGLAKHEGEADSSHYGMDRVVIHYVLKGYEENVSNVLRILHAGGRLGYIVTHIDDFSMIGHVMKCPVKPAQCLGGSRCDFVKAVSLSHPIARPDPFELASLLVHEAAHLEMCYDDEDYAWSQEEMFKSALFAHLRGEHHMISGYDVVPSGLLMKARVHAGIPETDPDLPEEFALPFVITPKRINKTL